MPSGSKKDRFTGRVVLVTGAGAGIGRATARYLAAEGGNVACLDYDVSAVNNTARQIVEDGGLAFPLSCDVSMEEEVQSAVHHVVESLGDLDVLVANAGVAGPVGPIVDLDLQSWLQLLSVNLTGQLLCAKYALRHMTRRQKGVIVFTASHASFAAVPGWTPYAATKGAVLSLTRGLAVDHAPDNIRVNCVSPGPIRTQLLSEGYVDIAKGGGQHDGSSRGRIGSPEEIASIIAFLASDDAELVNGTSVVADAGALAHMGISWPSNAYWS